MIGVGENVCRDLESALRREWLETSGIGGFASSTINGCNTREYHGLLIVAAKPQWADSFCPLIAFRDYHSLTHENGAINGVVP